MFLYSPQQILYFRIINYSFFLRPVWSRFDKYFPELEEYEVVKVSRRIGKAKLYKINLEHPLVKMLREYEKKVSMQIAQKEANKARKMIQVKA